MNKQKEKPVTRSLNWVTERETALSILGLLAKLGKASRYDLSSQLSLSYATVMNYVRKFKEAGIVEEIGEVEAKRGGKKVIFEPTQKALDILSDVESSRGVTLEIQQPTALPSLGFYSLGMPEDKGKIKRRGKFQGVLKDMKIDVAIVVSYRGHGIPVLPISTLGSIDQVNAIFSDIISQRILEVAIQVAQKITEET